MTERADRRPGTQKLDCAGEGLSTCRRIKDSGLHGEDYLVGPSERHTDRGRVIEVRPELVIVNFRV